MVVGSVPFINLYSLYTIFLFLFVIVTMSDMYNINVIIESYQYAKLSLEEQIRITSETSILITACGKTQVT